MHREEARSDQVGHPLTGQPQSCPDAVGEALSGISFSSIHRSSHLLTSQEAAMAVGASTVHKLVRVLRKGLLHSPLSSLQRPTGSLPAPKCQLQ